MIPITYALIGFALSSLVGAVLMLLFKAAYDRTAENVEQFGADSCERIAKTLQIKAAEWQARANALRTPGK